jgi:hypothetical protein
MSIDGTRVTLYVEGAHEHAVLEPIGAELGRRGAHIHVTADFAEPADVGLYACHANRFFDYSTGRWQQPPNHLAVLSVHDLGQAGSAGADYFSIEPWHAFDLGLIPGREWEELYERAVAAGASGPTLGVRRIGWPKMDHVHAEAEAFRAAVLALKQSLGTGERPVVLLACSWSDRRQLTDALETIDLDRYDVVVKYPTSGPPPPESPWRERLEAAWEDLQRTREVAAGDPRVVVAADDSDIMLLLAACDIVLSNGSNVGYEGVLVGRPGISIRDWVHPAGASGESTVRPYVDLPGVLSGDLRMLGTMLEVVSSAEWRRLVDDSAAALVDPSTHGRAALLAADAIESAFALGPKAIEARRAEGQPLDPAPSGLSAVEDQLRRYEEEIAALRHALEAAGVREAAARVQLDTYERELSSIRDELGR